jgi:hypothetical protein
MTIIILGAIAALSILLNVFLLVRPREAYKDEIEPAKSNRLRSRRERKEV